jgi:hypothetical protein
MNKILLMLLLTAGMADWSHAQQVPKEVQKMIDGYTQDSTSHFGLKAAQRSLGVDRSLQSTDIQVGQPVEVYNIRESALDTCGDDLPLRELLVPANTWTFAVKAHGKYIYDLDIAKRKDGTWFWVGAGELKPDNWWQKLRKTYPDSSGINPILIDYEGFKYLYFPQKSTHNFFFIKYGNEQFPFAWNTSNSMDSLDDGKILVPRLKQNWKNGQSYRDAYNKKHPGTFNNKSTEGGGK